METPLERWRGTDVVTASAVFHHLTDEQVGALIGRLGDQVEPARMVFTDGVAIGPLKETLIRLDEGEPSRQPEPALRPLPLQLRGHADLVLRRPVPHLSLLRVRADPGRLKEPGPTTNVCPP